MQWTLFKMVHHKIKLYIVTTEHCLLHNVVSCKSIQFLIEMYLLFPENGSMANFITNVNVHTFYYTYIN